MDKHLPQKVLASFFKHLNHRTCIFLNENIFHLHKKSNPDQNLMIFSSPKFQRFSLFINSQVRSVLNQNNKSRHNNTFWPDGTFSLVPGKLIKLDERVKGHKKVTKMVLEEHDHFTFF